VDVARYLFAFLVFPGFVFTGVVGLVSTWVDRKVTARVQWRVGPPLLQPFYDFVKLLGKETLIPSTASRAVFMAAPLAGLTAVTLVSTILWLANLTGLSFVGDLIVVVYLLIVPSLAIMIGGMASGNPLASTGASREMKLILSYELPFLICLAVVILKNGFSLRLGDLAQGGARAPVGSISGAVAAVIALLCVQAKLGFTPFDVAEAETEIMGGPYIEYSGVSLGVFRLTQAMMLFSLPVFLITVFLGGIHLSGWGILWAILKFVAILVLIIVIKNTNPRVRIDQAVSFFWVYLTPVAAGAFVLAVLGRVFGIPWL
jgi:NADH-quinone oxidoreductase subunit H